VKARDGFHNPGTVRVHFQHSQYSKKKPDTKIQYRAFFFKLVGWRDLNFRSKLLKYKYLYLFVRS
jgi:hypothetical protein